MPSTFAFYFTLFVWHFVVTPCLLVWNFIFTEKFDCDINHIYSQDKSSASVISIIAILVKLL